MRGRRLDPIITALGALLIGAAAFPAAASSDGSGGLSAAQRQSLFG